jgi:hypothetical protein
VDGGHREMIDRAVTDRLGFAGSAVRSASLAALPRSRTKRCRRGRTGAVSKCALGPSRPIPRSIRKSDFVPLSGLLSVQDNPFQSNPETKDGNGFKRETRLQEPPISGPPPAHHAHAPLRCRQRKAAAIPGDGRATLRPDMSARATSR